MQRGLPLAAALVAVSRVASATQGIDCSALDGSGTGLSLTLGAAPGHSVLFATLRTGEATRSTIPDAEGEPIAVSQAYLTEEWFAVDLVDAESGERVADARVLRVEADRRLHQYGYLRLDGEVHPITCEGP